MAPLTATSESPGQASRGNAHGQESPEDHFRGTVETKLKRDTEKYREGEGERERDETKVVANAFTKVFTKDEHHHENAEHHHQAASASTNVAKVFTEVFTEVFANAERRETYVYIYIYIYI